MTLLLECGLYEEVFGRFVGVGAAVGHVAALAGPRLSPVVFLLVDLLKHDVLALDEVLEVQDVLLILVYRDYLRKSVRFGPRVVLLLGIVGFIRALLLFDEDLAHELRDAAGRDALVRLPFGSVGNVR